MDVNLRELRQELAALTDRAEEILAEARSEDRQSLTAEEREKLDKLWEDIAAKRQEIEDEERRQEARGFIGNEPYKHDPDSTPQGNKQDEERFGSFGEFLQAVAYADMPTHRSDGPDERLLKQKEQRAISGMSETVPSDGGWFVQTDFIAELLKRTYQTGLLASRCRRIGVGPNSNGIKMNAIDESSRADGSRWGGVRVYWENEGESTTATEPKLRRVELSLEKLMGLCYATEELLEDASALESVVMQAFSEEFGFKLDDAIVRGTGAGQPLGMLNADALVSVSEESGQAADTIEFENIVKMYSRMYAPSRPNAVWLINQDIEPQLFTMSLEVGTGGVPVYMPAGGASSSPYGTLMGRPVLPVEQADTVGDQGDIMFADLSQYLLIDKGGMESASSIHVRFLYGENTYRFTYRVNGQPWWDSALTPANSSNTLSPFVTLDARA